MTELAIERARIENEVQAWVDARDSHNKRAIAPTLLDRMIAVLRTAVRQDLAKDQISKAIKALWRNDMADAGEHMKRALYDVAHAPVSVAWEELSARVARLRAGHPQDEEQ